MLIFLDDTITAVLNPPSAEHVAALSRLAMSHHEGSHFVTGSRSLIKRLSQNPALERTAQVQFKEVLSQVNDGHALCKAASARIQVFSDAGPRERIVRLPDSCIFQVPLSDFRSSLHVQATTLLGERLLDASLYRKFAIAHVHRNMRGTFTCAARLLGGGGSTIFEQFIHKADEEGIIFCLSDSDQKHVSAGLGSTAAALKRARDELHRKSSGFIAADVHILSCHELENLLPGRLLLDALPRESSLDMVTRCERAFKENKLGQADYADIKELLGSESLLEFVLKWAREKSAKEISDYLFSHDPPANAWRLLGEKIFAWTCAPKRRSTS